MQSFDSQLNANSMKVKNNALNAGFNKAGGRYSLPDLIDFERETVSNEDVNTPYSQGSVKISTVYPNSAPPSNGFLEDYINYEPVDLNSNN